MFWQIFTALRPYDETLTENDFRAQLHSGVRPDMSKFPRDTPPVIKDILERGWDADRSKRPTAIEIFQVCNQILTALEGLRCDIFLSHAWVTKKILSYVYDLLVKSGYRVWYDEYLMGKKDLYTKNNNHIHILYIMH